MKRTISIKFVLALVLCLTILPISVFAEPFGASDGGPAPLPSLQSVSAFSTPSVQNLMSDPGFETSAGGWNSPYGGSLSRSSERAKTGSYSLRMRGRTQTWYSPAFDMYPLIKQNGPGTYAVSFWVYVSAYTDGSTASAARLIIRGQAEDANSFISGHSDGNYYCVLNPVTITVVPGQWVNLSATFTVEQEDLLRTSGDFKLMLDTLAPCSYMYIDDVILCQLSDDGIIDPWVSSGSLIGAEQYYNSNLSVISNYIHVKRNSAYGSIAYNFVNMLRAHGPGTYRFRFQARLGDDASTNTENMSPYISTSSEKHISLGPVTLSKSSWQYFDKQIDITQAMIDFYDLTDDKTFLRFQGNVDTLSGFYITDVNITPPVISNGVYYFKNAGTQKYMDIEGPAAGSGTQIHQWDLHGDTSQRWDVQFVSNDHYKIQSVYSGLYLSVANNSTAQDAAIVQNSFDWLNGQLFKFERTAAGNIKITPKTGSANNRVLAVGWSVANTNGVNIEQRNYSEDSNYIDEWIAEKRVDRYILRSFISEEILASDPQGLSNVVSYSQFASGALNRSFGIPLYFEMPNVKELSSDQVHAGSCSDACGECVDTYSPGQTNIHHLNYRRIAREELTRKRATNDQIHVLWHSRPGSDFCRNAISHTADGAFGVVYDKLPVANIFDTPVTTDADPELVFKYVLLHEISHVLGRSESYLHTRCIARSMSTQAEFEEFFAMYYNDGEEVFCDQCKQEMLSIIGRPLKNE